MTDIAHDGTRMVYYASKRRRLQRTDEPYHTSTTITTGTLVRRQGRQMTKAVEHKMNDEKLICGNASID